MFDRAKQFYNRIEEWGKNKKWGRIFKGHLFYISPKIKDLTQKKHLNLIVNLDAFEVLEAKMIISYSTLRCCLHSF